MTELTTKRDNNCIIVIKNVKKIMLVKQENRVRILGQIVAC